MPNFLLMKWKLKSAVLKTASMPALHPLSLKSVHLFTLVFNKETIKMYIIFFHSDYIHILDIIQITFQTFLSGKVTWKASSPHPHFAGRWQGSFVDGWQLLSLFSFFLWCLLVLAAQLSCLSGSVLFIRPNQSDWMG